MVLSPRAQGIADGTWHTKKETKKETSKVTPPKTIKKPKEEPKEEAKCNVCGDSPEDCECEVCDCDKV